MFTYEDIVYIKILNLIYFLGWFLDDQSTIKTETKFSHKN